MLFIVFEGWQSCCGDVFLPPALLLYCDAYISMRGNLLRFVNLLRQSARTLQHSCGVLIDTIQSMASVEIIGIW